MKTHFCVKTCEDAITGRRNSAHGAQLLVMRLIVKTLCAIETHAMTSAIISLQLSNMLSNISHALSKCRFVRETKDDVRH